MRATAEAERCPPGCGERTDGPPSPAQPIRTRHPAPLRSPEEELIDAHDICRTCQLTVSLQGSVTPHATQVARIARPSACDNPGASNSDVLRDVYTLVWTYMVTLAETTAAEIHQRDKVPPDTSLRVDARSHSVI